MLFRQRLQVVILLMLTLLAFASYHPGTGGVAWLQWLTLISIFVFLLIFDLAFTNDSQFIFDPDADNWRRKVVCALLLMCDDHQMRCYEQEIKTHPTFCLDIHRRPCQSKKSSTAVKQRSIGADERIFCFKRGCDWEFGLMDESWLFDSFEEWIGWRKQEECVFTWRATNKNYDTVRDSVLSCNKGRFHFDFLCAGCP
jgi:hypothetical protein